MNSRYQLVGQIQIFLDENLTKNETSLYKAKYIPTSEPCVAHKIKIDYSKNLNDFKIDERVKFIGNQRFKYYPQIIDRKIEKGYLYVAYKNFTGASLRSKLFSGRKITEEQGLNLGLALLKGYGVFLKNNISHQDFYDDEIFFQANGEILILPPLRWAAGTGRLDNIQINYKSPEALNLQKTGNVAIEQKKFIWKLAVLLYTSINGTCPWSFQMANDNRPGLKVDPQSVNNFKNFIFKNINRPSYDQTMTRINKWLPRALVWDFKQRVDYQISLGYFKNTVEGAQNQQQPNNQTTSNDFKTFVNVKNQSNLPNQAQRQNSINFNQQPRARAQTVGGGMRNFPTEDTSTPFDEHPHPIHKIPSAFYRPFQKMMKTMKTPFDDHDDESPPVPVVHGSQFTNSNTGTNQFKLQKFESKNPFERRDQKIKSHLNTKSKIGSRINIKPLPKVDNTPQLSQIAEVSYDISPEDEILVNDLIDDIDKTTVQVSFQDNLNKYKENKENTANHIIQRVKTEQIEDEEDDDFLLDFDYDEDELDEEIDQIISVAKNSREKQEPQNHVNPTKPPGQVVIPSPGMNFVDMDLEDIEEGDDEDLEKTINQIEMFENKKQRSNLLSQLSSDEIKTIKNYFFLIRCRIFLHKKICKLIDDLGIKSGYRIVIQVYLLIHSRRKLQQSLDILANDENPYFQEGWLLFKETDTHSDIVNMCFTDFNENEDQLVTYVKKLKTFMKSLPRQACKDISAVLKAYRNEEISVWEALELLLLGFAERVVAKQYNRTKDKAKKLGFVRLEAVIYLCSAFNDMGIFEPDYAGETMLEEMVMVSNSQEMSKLQNLIARLNNILFG